MVKSFWHAVNCPAKSPLAVLGAVGPALPSGLDELVGEVPGAAVDEVAAEGSAVG